MRGEQVEMFAKLQTALQQLVNFGFKCLNEA